MNDTKLAKQIQDGDRDAARKFVLEHYETVYRLHLRLTNHREDAEDLTQQTFITARRSIAAFRGSATLRTWIHQVAVNEYRQWRRRKRWIVRLFRDDSALDQGVQTFETGYVLSQAIAKLSDKLRTACVLFEIEQHSMNEVATILGVPTGTAKARVAMARQKLRTLLEEQTEVNNDEITEPTFQR